MSYDEIPYTSKTNRGRHPDRLCTIGTLLGMKPIPPDGARILELGCSTGHNLVSIALTLPKSRCTGIDLSPEQIKSASDLAKNVGVTNVEFKSADIASEALRPGGFDYIFCHGVFSWVPQQIQEKILEQIGSALAPAGIACVSYNTLPGWYTRLPVREFILKHDKKSDAPESRIKRAREVLTQLEASVGHDYDRPYSVLLHNELRRIAQEPDHYLFHEFLSESNTPIYISEFLVRAKKYELKFLGDARFSRMSMNRLMNAEVPSIAFKNVLRLSSDQAALEETMDVIFHNPFRETLLCRSSVELRSEVNASELKLMSFAGNVKREEEATELTDRDEDFLDARGVRLTLRKPLFKSALDALSEAWPRYLSFSELLSECKRRCKLERASSESDIELSSPLLGVLLEWYQRDLVDLSLHPPRLSASIPSRPTASPLARIQTKKSSIVTNLAHNSIEVGELEREFIKMLDGTIGIEELRERVKQLIKSGAGRIAEDGVEVSDPEREREMMDDLIIHTIETLHRAGLFAPET